MIPPITRTRLVNGNWEPAAGTLSDVEATVVVGIDVEVTNEDVEMAVGVEAGVDVVGVTEVVVTGVKEVNSELDVIEMTVVVIDPLAVLPKITMEEG